MTRLYALILLALALQVTPAYAQEASHPADQAAESADQPTTGAPMTVARLGELISRVDDEARKLPNGWEFILEDRLVAVLYDASADRMRIMIPIAPAKELEPAQLLRLLQANFDSALDARYAIAREVLWGTYIHPLSPLDDEQFLVGLGQTLNVVATFGSSYTSGMFLFGGGDSAAIERRKLIDKLKDLGTST